MNAADGARMGFRVARLAVVSFFADDMPTHAAALAYRMLFSLFPFLIFLTTLLGFLGMPQLFEWLREQASYLLPAQGMEQVNAVLRDLQAPPGGLMSVAIAVSVWSASVGIVGTMNALNVAYDVKERRPVWKRILVSIMYTVTLAAMLIAAAAAMLSGPTLLTWIAQYVGLDALFIAVWAWLRWAVAGFLLLLVVALVYWAGSERQAAISSDHAWRSARRAVLGRRIARIRLLRPELRELQQDVRQHGLRRRAAFLLLLVVRRDALWRRG